MIKKIQRLLATAMTAVLLLAPGVAVPALAGGAIASADIANELCTGSKSASGSNTDCQANGDANAGLTQLARTITTWFSIIVGAISILMIIYGGFRYITSGGDSGKVGNAKNTLIYAIIGLIIVALAQLIVNVVLTQADKATTNFQ
jgi:hypothetical protein